jgi:hypothetical protein
MAECKKKKDKIVDLTLFRILDSNHQFRGGGGPYASTGHAIWIVFSFVP